MIAPRQQASVPTQDNINLLATNSTSFNSDTEKMSLYGHKPAVFCVTDAAVVFHLKQRKVSAM